MKGKRPFKSRLRRQFMIVAATVTAWAGGITVENLPRDPVSDTQKITTTVNPETQEVRGYNISLIDQFWKRSLSLKSLASRQDDLRLAAARGDSWRVETLMKYDDIPAAIHQEAINNAAARGHEDVLDVFRKYDIQPRAGAILAALIGGQQALAQKLTIEIRPTGTHLHEALRYAAALGHLSSVHFFLQHGADPRLNDNSVLVAAVASGETAVVQRLLDHRNAVYLPHAFVPPPSYLSGIGYGYDQYNPHHPDLYQRGMHAYGDPMMVDDMMRRGVIPADLERAYYTPRIVYKKLDINAGRGIALSTAIARGDAAMIAFLVGKGADVNINDGAPLLQAAQANRVDIVQLLRRLGADPQKGHAMQHALSHGKKNIVAALEGKLLPPDAPDAKSSFMPPADRLR